MEEIHFPWPGKYIGTSNDFNNIFSIKKISLIQFKRFNDHKVHAEARLSNASEQLSEIKKVAKKEIFEFKLKLKDSESKLALKKEQIYDIAKSCKIPFSKAPIHNSNESFKESRCYNHSNHYSKSNGSEMAECEEQ
ncbi:hypothetical protein DICPUDRAFT_74135 [Dictyostelium purpureum]|uniref:Uncharacterized protein n=1 Tax=Dictyostelium purpureum TaxID=5786 RepID=F0Z6R0_DICPU|nr:uncharacterized protein DICPUDRAFT_74135 [Dictyostelium purpureum]EGC40403.1 hypothetical protein DICPUDRAFT_74135 [Dictyostelium purpureum]|eukprot:XP_003283154.1 hypothetical protein DICPUDRAFT_74135 [Dictyostelium purpureum]